MKRTLLIKSWSLKVIEVESDSLEEATSKALAGNGDVKREQLVEQKIKIVGEGDGFSIPLNDMQAY